METNAYDKIKQLDLEIKESFKVESPIAVPVKPKM